MKLHFPIFAISIVPCFLLIGLKSVLNLHSIISVVLVSLWRFSLIRGEEFQELLSELICWNDPAYVKFLILREIIIAFICFALHHKRYIVLPLLDKKFMPQKFRSSASMMCNRCLTLRNLLIFK